MSDLSSDLNESLATLRQEGLYRELRQIDSPQCPRITINGQSFLNFSSNDYLGLANEPLLKEAAIRAIEKYGTGSGASRLICGSLGPHHDLDEAIAEFKGVEAALSFATGYTATLGTITALLGKEDILILDKLVHASIVDAARLCGAKLRLFAHNDLNQLEDRLKWASGAVHSPAITEQRQKQRPKVLVVTESVFSMDGDQAPLKQIVELKNRYGAWLMLDEAHGTGLYGKARRGLAEELGVSDLIEINMGTLGKAFGASGGYICGSRALIDYLINRARSFIFSTAPVPAAAAAATAGVRFVQSAAGEERRKTLWERVYQLQGSACLKGKPIPATRSAIIPLVIGDEAKAVEVAAELRRKGILIPAIRYPTVARGTARLRLTLTAAHRTVEVEQVRTALGNLCPTGTLPG